jgi:hypothetical protein
MRAEDADLPLLAHDDPAFAGVRFHEVLDDLASRSWLARSDLGYTTSSPAVWERGGQLGVSGR